MAGPAGPLTTALRMSFKRQLSTDRLDDGFRLDACLPRLNSNLLQQLTVTSARQSTLNCRSELPATT